MINSKPNQFGRFIIPILLLVLYIFARKHSVTLLHYSTQISSILLLFALYVISWNTRHYVKSTFYSTLGIGLIAICILKIADLALQLNVIDIPVLYKSETAHILRSYEVFIFSIFTLISYNLYNRKIKPRLWLTITLFLFIYLSIDLFYIRRFPYSLLAKGITGIATLELISVAGIIISSVIIIIKRNSFDNYEIVSLLVCYAFIISSEILHLFFHETVSIGSEISEILFPFGLFFLYEAVISASLRRSAQVLFRNINIQLNELSEGMMNGLVCIRKDQFGEYRIIESNNYITKTTGLSRYNIYRKPVDQIFGSDLLPLIKEVDSTRNSMRREFYSPLLDRDFIISLFPYGSDILALAVFDITEKKKLSERLKQAEKMSAIGEIAGGISHDFNNQLAAFDCMVQMLKDKNKDQELSEGFAKLGMAIERATHLTHQLLSFSRKSMRARSELDIHQLVDEIVGLLEISVGSRISVEKSLDADFSIIVGDEGLLENALLNLGINARDAQPEGGSISVHTKNVVFSKDKISQFSLPLDKVDYIEINISDKGTGMTEDTMKKIFQPFFTTKREGSGMGLSMVYRCLELHRGDIKIESIPGVGTSISIYLPVLTKSTAVLNLPNKKEIKKSSKPDLSGKNIIIIDDEDIIRQNFSRILRKENASVYGAGDANEALNLCKKLDIQWDFLLLDNLLPDARGTDLIKKLKPWLNNSVNILITGYADDSLEKKAQKAGIMKVLIKPVKIKTLLETLH